MHWRCPVARLEYPRHHPETTAWHSNSPNWTPRASPATRKCGSRAILTFRTAPSSPSTARIAAPRSAALDSCAYADDDAALTDVLRLARGMTYKCAAANIPLGGGKSVILAAT